MSFISYLILKQEPFKHVCSGGHRQDLITSFILLLFVSCSSLLAAGEHPYVTDEVWQRVKPFFLPDAHPIKLRLDRLFRGRRLTATEKTLVDAGFTFPSQVGLHITPVLHKEIEGYLLKIYVDYKKTECDWEEWLKRIEGADRIRSAIAALGYNKEFKVPKKWIYPLPINPPPPEGPDYIRKNFILVVQNMWTLPLRENHSTWRKQTTKSQLDALYEIVTMLGLRDSCRVANVPRCQDGKIAFVDTEYYDHWPVNYHPLIEFLSKENRLYWRELTEGLAP